MIFRNNSNYKHILFLIVAIFTIWFVVQIKDVALLFFGAFVISCSLYPTVDQLSKKMPRAAATTVIIILSVLLVIGVFFPVAVTAFREIKSLFSMLPDTVNDLTQWIRTTKIMGYDLKNIFNGDVLTISTGNIAENILNKSFVITMGIIDAITVLFSILMIVFYLVYEREEINKSTLTLFPPKLKARAAEIIIAIETKVGGYVAAQVLSMSTVAFFTVLGLMICKIEYALLLGIIAGILDIIPIVGPTVALILGISSALTKGWIWIIPTIAVFLIAQWISNQLVRPIVFGKFMKLHPLVVLFSFFVAAKFLGVWGVILAPAIAALILTLFDELYIKTINSKVKKNDE